MWALLIGSVVLGLWSWVILETDRELGHLGFCHPTMGAKTFTHCLFDAAVPLLGPPTDDMPMFSTAMPSSTPLAINTLTIQAEKPESTHVSIPTQTVTEWLLTTPLENKADISTHLPSLETYVPADQPSSPPMVGMLVLKYRPILLSLCCGAGIFIVFLCASSIASVLPTVIYITRAIPRYIGITLFINYLLECYRYVLDLLDASDAASTKFSREQFHHLRGECQDLKAENQRLRDGYYLYCRQVSDDTAQEIQGHKQDVRKWQNKYSQEHERAVKAVQEKTQLDSDDQKEIEKLKVVHTKQLQNVESEKEQLQHRLTVEDRQREMVGRNHSKEIRRMERKQEDSRERWETKARRYRIERQTLQTELQDCQKTLATRNKDFDVAVMKAAQPYEARISELERRFKGKNLMDYKCKVRDNAIKERKLETRARCNRQKAEITELRKHIDETKTLRAELQKRTDEERTAFETEQRKKITNLETNFDTERSKFLRMLKITGNIAGSLQKHLYSNVELDRTYLLNVVYPLGNGDMTEESILRLARSVPLPVLQADAKTKAFNSPQSVKAPTNHPEVEVTYTIDRSAHVKPESGSQATGASKQATQLKTEGVFKSGVKTQGPSDDSKAGPALPKDAPQSGNDGQQPSKSIAPSPFEKVASEKPSKPQPGNPTSSGEAAPRRKPLHLSSPKKPEDATETKEASVQQTGEPSKQRTTPATCKSNAKAPNKSVVTTDSSIPNPALPGLVPVNAASTQTIGSGIPTRTNLSHLSAVTSHDIDLLTRAMARMKITDDANMEVDNEAVPTSQQAARENESFAQMLQPFLALSQAPATVSHHNPSQQGSDGDEMDGIEHSSLSNLVISTKQRGWGAAWGQRDDKVDSGNEVEVKADQGAPSGPASASTSSALSTVSISQVNTSVSIQQLPAKAAQIAAPTTTSTTHVLQHPIDNDWAPPSTDRQDCRMIDTLAAPTTLAAAWTPSSGLAPPPQPVSPFSPRSRVSPSTSIRQTPALNGHIPGYDMYNSRDSSSGFIKVNTARPSPFSTSNQGKSATSNYWSDPSFTSKLTSPFTVGESSSTKASPSPFGTVEERRSRNNPLSVKAVSEQKPGPSQSLTSNAKPNISSQNIQTKSEISLNPELCGPSEASTSSDRNDQATGATSRTQSIISKVRTTSAPSNAVDNASSSHSSDVNKSQDIESVEEVQAQPKNAESDIIHNILEAEEISVQDDAPKVEDRAQDNYEYPVPTSLDEEQASADQPRAILSAVDQQLGADLESYNAAITAQQVPEATDDSPSPPQRQTALKRKRSSISDFSSADTSQVGSVEDDDGFMRSKRNRRSVISTPEEESPQSPSQEDERLGRILYDEFFNAAEESSQADEESDGRTTDDILQCSKKRKRDERVDSLD
ncbi:MAG: hypothetical protein Q9164_002054 [Protoblastenia rupestris]